MSTLSIALAIRQEPLRDEARAALLDQPVRICGEFNEAGPWDEFLDSVSQESPLVLLLDTTLVTGDPSDLFAFVRQRLPHARIIALHPTADPQVILAAMRFGVTEFLFPPLAGTLPAALERLAVTVPGAPAAPKRGKIHGFVSAKGGCGATTIACHVASEAQRLSGKDTLLVDLDIKGGITSFVMKVTGRYSILDATVNVARLDADMWRALTVTNKAGLRILPEPQRLSGERLDVKDAQRVVRFLRSQHDYIFLDLGNGVSPLTVALLEEMDTLFIVSTLDVPALHCIKSLVRTLKVSSADIRKVQLILNRMPKTSDVSAREVEKILERQLYATFGNEYTALYTAYVNGTLVAPTSRMGGQFSEVAARIAGLEVEPSRKRFALFG